MLNLRLTHSLGRILNPPWESRLAPGRRVTKRQQLVGCRQRAHVCFLLMQNLIPKLIPQETWLPTAPLLQPPPGLTASSTDGSPVETRRSGIWPSSLTEFRPPKLFISQCCCDGRKEECLLPAPGALKLGANGGRGADLEKLAAANFFFGGGKV